MRGLAKVPVAKYCVTQIASGRVCATDFDGIFYIASENLRVHRCATWDLRRVVPDGDTIGRSNTLEV